MDDMILVTVHVHQPDAMVRPQESRLLLRWRYASLSAFRLSSSALLSLLLLRIVGTLSATVKAHDAAPDTVAQGHRGTDCSLERADPVCADRARAHDLTVPSTSFNGPGGGCTWTLNWEKRGVEKSPLMPRDVRPFSSRSLPRARLAVE